MAEEERVIEMSEKASKLIYFAADDARQKLEQGGEFPPFTVLADAENMYIETHPGETVEECFESAYKTITSAASEIDGYVFCYDGLMDTDDGQRDCIVVECAEKDEEIGNAFGFTYTITPVAPAAEGELIDPCVATVVVDDPPQYLDMVPSFFIDTLEDRFGEPCGCGCEDGEHDHDHVHEHEQDAE